MHQDLVQPIKERIALGHPKEAIKKEVTGFGYSADDFEEAYAAASAGGQSSGQSVVTRKMKSSQSLSKTGFIWAGVAMLVILFLVGGIWATRAYYVQAPISDPFVDGAYEEWRDTIDDATIINVVRPSVVRVLTHFVGTTTLQRFDIDFNTLELTLEEGDPEPVVRTFDSYGTGSGFFVSEHGRIITNAHVVFPSSLRESIFDEWLQGEIYEQIERDPEFDLNTFLERMDELSRDDDGALERDMMRFMVNHSGLEYESEVAVLDPGGEGETFNELLDDSIPARVIALEENFEFEDKDAAVIEISATDLPALRVSDVNEVMVGDPVYVFGYPGNTDLTNVDSTESSFTTGVVNAIKDAPYGDFELIQTDAKISGGSSGGPMVNGRGEVIGLVTLATGGFFGDNFGFAIPVSVLDQLEGYVDGDDTQGHQHQSIIKGLFLLDQKHCEMAIEYFNRGLASNETFNNSAFVQEKINACNTMIESGDSIDTRYDQIKQVLKDSEMMTLVLLGGVLFILLLIVTGLIVIVLKNRRSIAENRQTIEEHHG